MMDLSSLDSTLPPALADAEREMGDKFRASALNITTMYKSSLGFMKQAYGVGYAACLSDVLSTVQSSMSAGQDPSQTLSRLMDWAEARETAMTALAADDDETTNTPHPGKSRPARPTTSTVPPPQSAAIKEEDHRGRSRHIPIPSSTPVSGESSSHSINIATPMTSSPLVGSSNIPRPPLKSRSSTSHSPSKSLHFRQEQAQAQSRPGPSAPSDSRPPLPLRIPQSSEFNPTNLPHYLPPTSESTPNPAVGSKRPLIDIDMADSASAPVTPHRGARSAKRRSMGLGLRDDEERSERKRASRRGHTQGHGHNHRDGHGHTHGQGPGAGGQTAS